MFKYILAVSLALTSIQTLAEAPPSTLNCTCMQAFEDHLGQQTEHIVHVRCPQAAPANLKCEGKIQANTFSSVCTDRQTGKSNKATISIDTWSEPVYGYSNCQLN